jgi:hypothetical protein
VDGPVEGFVGGYTRQSQIPSQGNKERIVNGAIVLGRNLQCGTEQALGWLNLYGATKKCGQRLTNLDQRCKASVLLFPDGVGDFSESQVEDEKAFALESYFID